MLVLQQYLFPAVLQCRSSSTSSTDAHYFCLSQSNFNVCKNSTMCVAGTGQIFSSAASAFASRSLSRAACAVASVSAVTTPKPTRTSLLEQEREVVRLGLPSKGRMATDTLELLKDCQLNVHQVNPRQYVADIPTLPNVEVWFQRPKDVVRKLLTGDLDLGIVGYDTVCEYGQDSDDLILVHDALEFGECHLSIAVPKDGIFANVSSMEDLSALPLWTAERPLRIVTGYSYLGKKFAKENGLKHVEFSTADGALEASPAMGIADAILDLVSSGTTLRENNLKELQGGTVLESQGVLVASRKALVQRKEILEAAHEMLERLEAHLRASGEFTITANMRGNSAEEVAERVLNETSFPGLQGPTVCPVYCKRDGEIKVDYFAIVICVPKRQLYEAVCDLRKIAGSGVLVSPLTYIFDEEPPRWRKLADELNINS